MKRHVSLFALTLSFCAWAFSEEAAAPAASGPVAPEPEAAAPAEKKDAAETAPSPPPAPSTEKPAEAAAAPAGGDVPPQDEALKAKLAEQERLIAELRAEIAKLQETVKRLQEESAAFKAQSEGKKNTKDQEQIQKLIASFRGTTSERFKAIEQLVKIGKPATPLLIEATRSEHFYVRQSAIQTLGDIEDLSSVPALLEVLGGDNLDLMSYANRSLSKLTSQYFGTLGVGESDEERKAVVENWKKWWAENSAQSGGASP
ncbi:MAG: HEAT repeat domain-containing protein [Planctomycetes bacterium]|nr:HEAT repeat domain-containing protein [Planctomycetota bacterium]